MENQKACYPDVLYIPVEAILKEQSKEFVYVRTKGGFSHRDVKIGSINTDFAVVTDGLKENEELALSDPYFNNQEGKGKETIATNRKK